MHPWQTNLANQLKELQLIQCSLLPGERFDFVLPKEDLAVWTSLLDGFIAAGFDNDDQLGVTHPPCQARFEIRVVGAQTWFEVTLPQCTDVDLAFGTSVAISVKGEHVSRDTHERWNTEVRARIAEVDVTCAFPVYEVLTHLTTSLHQSRDPSPPVACEAVPHPTPNQPPYHALLTSHHLVSINKRRTMHQLSSELAVSGFAKVGYPGIIYVEGPHDAVKAFVKEIKGMQWLALRVRFVEPVPELDSSPKSGSGSDTVVTRDQSMRWVEVSKVGEVLELMRIRGRVALVTNLGIGAPSK